MVLVHVLVYFSELELGQGHMFLASFGVLELEVDYNVAEYSIPEHVQ